MHRRLGVRVHRTIFKVTTDSSGQTQKTEGITALAFSDSAGSGVKGTHRLNNTGYLAPPPGNLCGAVSDWGSNEDSNQGPGRFY